MLILHQICLPTKNYFKVSEIIQVKLLAFFSHKSIFNKNLFISLICSQFKFYKYNNTIKFKFF